ncbi:MAG TPA: hypothetical protein VJW20_07295 [Candidatus Angelobacter sp.]|nr:hypothetical protein [Candidatus Angelobacter sp.]
MAMNLDIDTRDLEPILRPAPAALPVDTQPLKSPFFVSQLPTTAIINPDAVVNFRLPGVPQQRIVPPQPISLSGAGLNATPTVATAPVLIQTTPAPSIASPLATIPTGYTFSFNQVRLPLSSTATINSYKVYRATTNNSATARVIQSIPHNPANTGHPIVVLDNQPNGVTEFYWVSAINIQGVESNLTPAQSAGVTSNAIANSNSQLASSFHNNPLNTNFSSLSTTTLSNNGLTTPITIAANTNQFAPGGLSYNSGSVDPTLFGNTIILAADPTFSGGVVVYSIAFILGGQVNSDANLIVGKIHSASGSTGTGGGTTGGTTGPSGIGGRGLVL